MNYHKPEFDYETIIQNDLSRWSAHRYFVYDLVCSIKPEIIADLHTCEGTSFFTLCQAVKDNKLQTRLTAIYVTGNEISGEFFDEYNRSVFMKVRDKFYKDLDISLISDIPQNTMTHFEDGSIDLLNINNDYANSTGIGDFQRWINKLSENGIILLHGIYDSDSQTAQLWKDLKSDFDTMEFSHSYGLGILFITRKVYESYSYLEEIWQRYYQTLEENERIFQQWKLKESEVRELENQIKELKLKEQNSINFQLNFLGGAARAKRLYIDTKLGFKLLIRNGIKEFGKRFYWYIKGKRFNYELNENNPAVRDARTSIENNDFAGGSAGNTAAVCIIVKNEAPYLLEWMAYYLALGFDRLVIYDNESTDNTRQIIQNARINDERIEYIYWQDIKGYSPQLTAYNDAIKRIDTEWIAFFDIDEFLVLKDHKNINEFLAGFDMETTAIAISWFMFGSSGYELYSNDLVIRRFTKCPNPKFPNNSFIKTIARRDAIKYMEIHTAELTRGMYRKANGDPVVILDYMLTPVPCHDAAQLNHYVLKSKEEYLKKRMRGDGSEASNSKEKYIKYTDELWAEHDRNEHSDFSIQSMIKPTIKFMDKLGKS